jgi:hypothetical protein
MSQNGNDTTGPAFPCDVGGFQMGFTGMTYRQWLAGQIVGHLMTNNKVIVLAMRRFDKDDELTRKKIAQAVWMLADYLIKEEHTGWPEEN